MDSKSWLNIATKKLKNEGIDSARLDALILLEDELGIDRALILAEPRPISSSKLKSLNKKLERRLSHEPLSFIREKTEFYGREFYINKDVLEPRPESETMIELLLEIVNGSHPLPKVQQSSGLDEAQGDSEEQIESYIKYDERAPQLATQRFAKRTNSMESYALQQVGVTPNIVDVGTGSGALAVTAKLELPKCNVLAVDIDEKCLVVARINAKRLNADIDFIQGDLIEPVKKVAPDILLANLPYVPDKYKLNPSTRFEPRLAIFGGKDGLDLYRQLFMQVNKLTNKPRYIFTESLPFQHQQLSQIAKPVGYHQTDAQDLIQVFEFLTYKS